VFLRYRAKFHVAQAYLAPVIGKKGSTRKRIEGETECRLAIPKQGQHGDVSATGPSAAAVRACYSRVTAVVEAARARQEATHFLSLPVNTQEMKMALETFKGEVNLEDGLFQEADLLHLTIGVMPLMGTSG